MPADVKGVGIGSPAVSLTVVTSNTSYNSNILSTAVATSQVSTSAPNYNPLTVKTSLPDTSLVNLSRLDLQNLDVDIVPKSTPGEAAPSLGSTTKPFGELFLEGNTLTIGGLSISVANVGGTAYLNLGSNVIIGTTQVSTGQNVALEDTSVFTLTELQDVSTSSLQDGDGLKYNSSTGKFENAQFVINTLNDLTDVNIAGSISQGQVLAYNATSSKFEPTSNVASSLDDLSNVDTSGKTNGSLLKYNSTSQKYEVAADNTLAIGTTGITAMAGNTTIPSTLSQLSNNTNFVTKTYVDNKVDSVVNGAPGALDTLNELADALGDDANFATTVTNSLATKAANTYVNTQLNLKVSQSTFVTTAMNDISTTSASNNQILVFSADNSHYAPKGIATVLGEATLSSLGDVSTQTPTANQILIYNGSQYVPGDQTAGGGGTLTSLTDTNISGTPTNGHALVYNASSGKWEAASVSAQGTLTGSDIKDLLEDVDGQVLTTKSVTASTAGTYVGDTFSINTLRSAKYVITINDSDDTTYYIAEILLIHNGSTVTFTLYGETTVGSLDIFPSYNADIVSSNVRLLITTTSNSQTIKVSRIGSKI